MEEAQFERMVSRLETQSSANPGAYRIKVALLALLGLGVIALLLGFAGSGLLLLAAASVALLFSGGKALLLLLKLGKLLVLLAIPLWLLLKSSMQALFTRLPKPEGQPLQRTDAPALFAAMDAMRRQMKGPRFHHVLLTDEMNAAVMQRPAFGLFGWPRNYLILGLPLLETLSPEEALAVVAHEYGHLAGSHSKFGAYIYRLRNTWGTIQAIAQSWQGWAGRPLKALVGWYGPYFNAYTFVLARANEYQADQASAELVGASTAARALKRTELAGPRYSSFLDDTAALMRQQAEAPTDLHQRWARVTTTEPEPAEATAWLASALRRPPALHDTHPGLQARLAALNAAETLDALPAPLLGASAAEQWLGAALPGYRAQFAAAWHDRVSSVWKERYEQNQLQLKELETLKAVEIPERAQWLRRILLQREYEPDFDALAALAAYTAAYPDDVSGLYHEGLQRLRQPEHEARGIEQLERVITLDPESTLPVCEQICQHLHAKGDERLKQWVERFQQRQQFEHTRSQQAQSFDRKHTLVAADLPDEQIERCRQLLQAHREDIAEAYLARRQLPVDPSYPTYVIAVRLGLKGRTLGRGEQVVERLAQLDWPFAAFIVALEKDNKSLRKRLAELPGARML